MAVHAAVTGVLASATGDCIEVAIRRAGHGCNCTVFDVGGTAVEAGVGRPGPRRAVGSGAPCLKV